MNSQEEIQLSDDLRDLVAGQPFVPDVEAIERRGHRQRRRSLAVRGLAGVTVLGVAAAGGLAVSARTGTSHATAGKSAAKAATVAPVPAKAETVAYVRQQILALNPDNYLIKDYGNTSSVPISMITIWTDPRTGNTMLLQGTGSGRLAYWEHDYFDARRVLHWDQTQVNYGPRTWWTYNEHAAGPIQGPVPPGPVGGDYYSPAMIKQIFAQGHARIVGHPYVDGNQTVELSVGTTPGLRYEIFADTQTYRVVRTIKYFPAKLAAPPITSDYTWALRSAAMVKLINSPQIPAGFTQVPAD